MVQAKWSYFGIKLIQRIQKKKDKENKKKDKNKKNKVRHLKNINLILSVICVIYVTIYKRSLIHFIYSRHWCEKRREDSCFIVIVIEISMKKC